VFSSYLA